MNIDFNLIKIQQYAESILGSEEAANDWIDKRSNTLGASPKELAGTPEGTARVMMHLSGISRHNRD